MDGSISTLAPIFATAFATHVPRTVFLIGRASAVAAGISMAFSEGLSDDGELTGRSDPIQRGLLIAGSFRNYAACDCGRRTRPAPESATHANQSLTSKVSFPYANGMMIQLLLPTLFDTKFLP
jgi:hypothetical protein